MRGVRAIPGSKQNPPWINRIHGDPAAGHQAHLQENAGVGQNKFINQHSMNSRMRPQPILGYLFRYALGRTGPLDALAVPAMGLVRSRSDLDEPDLQIHFMPLGYDADPNAASWDSKGLPKEKILTLYASVCPPYSRGRVVLGKDRRPLAQHQLLGDPRDMATLGPELLVHGVQGLRVADASIIPTSPSTNTNATTIMIGEKVADIIAGRHIDAADQGN